jgi:DNA polymerase I-like protein with 3'-5' exonuclease and polymerase domains
VLAPLPRPAQLVLQVHDSLLVACPQNLVEDCIRAMKAAMEQNWDPLGGYSIPASFKVGAVGQSWGELSNYELEEK